uniref:CKLF-like MARVEL transmembrane domain-containing protein 6 n=1 Tax=Doryrhamphus excisus TaxID=161450 RepID=UPI0025AE344C|nr:CKLF-like MARVEL transmembrane domain-containing protein 6 [Doryrhamphus excisus]
MATHEVYSSTTAPNPNSSCFLVPSPHLDKKRFIVKIMEVLLSLVAFILEEVVYSCIDCMALEFFEFVSCMAFLFTLLLLILLSTTLKLRLGISWWPRLDFLYTGAMAFFFFLASIVFAAINSATPLEKSAVVFGFLATAAFVCDLVLFWKTYGLPFAKGEKAEPSESNVSAVEAPVETEKLNTDAKATE